MTWRLEDGKPRLLFKFKLLTIACLHLRISLDTARQIAWNPFPVSPSSDVRVKYSEFPDERITDGIVEPQNVPSSGDLDWKEKKGRSIHYPGYSPQDVG